MTKKGTDGKIDLLGELGRFDVTGIPQGLLPGKTTSGSPFVYPSVGEKGKCVNLFKVLQTNFCENNCFYCANRKDRNCQRMEFKPEELASLFLQYYKRGWVKGIFLSSGISVSPDASQEKMLQTLVILRKRYGYQGYIHCKILPGVDIGLIEATGKLADRVSVNLEAPNQKYLAHLTRDKDFKDGLFSSLCKVISFHRRYPLKAGVTTQVVVGAGGEKDKDILLLSERLYRNLDLARVYYSAFLPVKDTPLENLPPCPPLRELRLYQADVLIRRYNFSSGELIFDRNGNLFLDKDPKLIWALNHPERFPVEVNKAEFGELIRVPGIGRSSAKKIMETRRSGRLKEIGELKKLGVITARAAKFITIGGKFFPAREELAPNIERQLFLWEEL